MNIEQWRVEFEEWLKKMYFYPSRKTEPDYTNEYDSPFTQGAFTGYIAAKQSAQEEIDLLKNDLVAERFKTKLFADEVAKLKQNEMTADRARKILEFDEKSITSLSSIPGVCGRDKTSIQLDREFSIEELKAIVYLMESKE